MNLKTTLFISSAVLGLLVGGCGEAEELIDCSQICQTKKECVDHSFDVSECTSRCETESDNDEDYRREAHECEACLDDRACAEQVACFDNCPSLSP